MEKFPEIENNQFVLVRADRNTGHVLDVNDNLKLRDDQKVYMVFNSLHDAIVYAKNKVMSNDGIECVIYNFRNEFIERIDKKTLI